MRWISHVYEALWPNMVAPSIWTLLGIGLSHAHHIHIARRHHREMIEHLRGQAGDRP